MRRGLFMRCGLFVSGILAAAVALVTLTAAGGAGQPAGTTITVVTKPSDYKSTRFVDEPPKSPTGQPDHISPGDVILSTVALRNEAGRRIGTRYDELTFVTPSVNFNSIDLVQSFYLFADGRIVVQAVHGPHLSGADPVTGGTGAFAGARGTVVDVSAKGSNTTKLAIRLLP